MARDYTLVYSTSWKNVTNSGQHFDELLKVFLEGSCNLEAVNVGMHWFEENNRICKVCHPSMPSISFLEVPHKRDVGSQGTWTHV